MYIYALLAYTPRRSQEESTVLLPNEGEERLHVSSQCMTCRLESAYVKGNDGCGSKPPSIL